MTYNIFCEAVDVTRLCFPFSQKSEKSTLSPRIQQVCRWTITILRAWSRSFTHFDKLFASISFSWLTSTSFGQMLEIPPEPSS